MARVPFEKVQKTVEVPQVQCIGEIIDVPVLAQRQVHTTQTEQKMVEMPCRDAKDGSSAADHGRNHGGHSIDGARTNPGAHR